MIRFRHYEHSSAIQQWIAASLTLFAVTIFFINAAYASSQEELSKTQAQIEQARKKHQLLKEERSALESELAELQKRLVSAADELQRREAALSDAEEKLTLIEEKQETKGRELVGEREKLRTLIEAAIRLSRTPPEAMVLMPEGGEKTIRAARAMKMATSGMKAQAELIRLQLAELASLGDKVKAQRDAMLRERALHLDKQKQVQESIGKRRNLQSQLLSEEDEQAKEIARLAKQAQDLKDLVGRIETARRSQASVAGSWRADGDSPRGIKGKLRSFSKAKGNIRPPASGRLVQSFGSQTARNETSRGIVLLTRPDASVTAPFDGEVVYAGSFMGYGRMVILKHSDDFHTLLSGLTDIDTKPGEFLLEGEPIGAMGDKDSSAKLYVELRKSNQPIDPAPWIKTN